MPWCAFVVEKARKLGHCRVIGKNLQLLSLLSFMCVSMRPKRLEAKGGCPVELTVSVMGGVWKPMILFHLLVTGRMRFMELSRAVPGATQRMPTQQLRELEADGVITRTVYPEVPPRVEYELTEV